jgi:hypothetical protein
MCQYEIEDELDKYLVGAMLTWWCRSDGLNHTFFTGTPNKITLRKAIKYCNTHPKIRRIVNIDFSTCPFWAIIEEVKANNKK